MQIKINPLNPEPAKINQAVEILKSGGIIVYPTDTIYGLGCDIFNKKAVEKIYQVKRRDKKKPFSIICPDIKTIAQFAIIPDYAFQILKKNLPGPFTFILKAKNRMPRSVLSKNHAVGVRIPNNKICLELVGQFGSPIITTSLNISGEKVLTSPDQLSKEMLNKIDLIIDAGTLADMPSTILDLSGDSPIIIRNGKGILKF